MSKKKSQDDAPQEPKLSKENAAEKFQRLLKENKIKISHGQMSVKYIDNGGVLIEPGSIIVTEDNGKETN